MPRVEFAYRPAGPTLERYILADESRAFIRGPLGSGKTNASCWRLFRRMCAQAPNAQGVRRSRWAAVRNTYPDLLSTTVKDWLEMFEDLGDKRRGTNGMVKGGLEPPTHFLSFHLPDGTRVETELIFLALDKEEHVKKLRGLQLTGGWLNEVKELPFAVVQMLDLRVGRFPQDVAPTWFGIFGDTNACDTDHWYYRLAEEDQPPGWLFLTQPGGLMRADKDAPWVENPAAENVENLPKAYYLRGAEGKDEDWIKVNLANEYGFVRDGMPVYPDYRDSTHCRTFELLPTLPIDIGLDFGLTPAAVVGQEMPNGQWRWRRELVTEDTGVIRFAGELKRFLGQHFPGYTIRNITGDPAGDQRQPGDSEERTVFQLLAAQGIEAKPAPTNDFAKRTEAVSAALRRLIDGDPGFLIHPDCKVTRKGMQGAYAFARVKVAGDERYQNTPVKNAYSHPCEAGQYLMLGGGAHTLLMPAAKKIAPVVPRPAYSPFSARR
jgi:hypothetical protein